MKCRKWSFATKIIATLIEILRLEFEINSIMAEHLRYTFILIRFICPGLVRKDIISGASTMDFSHKTSLRLRRILKQKILVELELLGKI